MRKYIDLLAYTNLWLGVSIVFATYATMFILGIEFHPFLFLVVFLLEFGIYNLNRHTDIKEDLINYPDRAKFALKYDRFLFPLSITSFLIALTLSLYLGMSTFLITAFLVILGSNYSVNFVKKFIGSSTFEAPLRLKNIFLMKNFAVALAWALATVSLPFSTLNKPLDMAYLLMFSYMFIRFFVNTVGFDMRDVLGDKKHNIKTLPVKIGTKKTKIVLLLLLTLLSLLILLAVYFKFLPKLSVLLILGNLYAYFYVLAYGNQHIDTNFFCDIIIDGEFIPLGFMFMLAPLF